MRKVFVVMIIMVTIFIGGAIWENRTVKADELEDIARQLEELNRVYELSVAATTPLESEVSKLSQKLANIQQAIIKAEAEVTALENNIFNREVDLEYQLTLLEQRVKSWYIS